MLIRVAPASEETIRQLKSKAARGEHLTATEQVQVDSADSRKPDTVFTGKDDGALFALRG